MTPTQILRQALEEIVAGYGPNHGSKWCFQTADEALAATQDQEHERGRQVIPVADYYTKGWRSKAPWA